MKPIHSRWTTAIAFMVSAFLIPLALVEICVHENEIHAELPVLSRDWLSAPGSGHRADVQLCPYPPCHMKFLDAALRSLPRHNRNKQAECANVGIGDATSAIPRLTATSLPSEGRAHAPSPTGIGPPLRL